MQKFELGTKLEKYGRVWEVAQITQDLPKNHNWPEGTYELVQLLLPSKNLHTWICNLEYHTWKTHE